MIDSQDSILRSEGSYLDKPSLVEGLQRRSDWLTHKVITDGCRVVDALIVLASGLLAGASQSELFAYDRRASVLLLICVLLLALAGFRVTRLYDFDQLMNLPGQLARLADVLVFVFGALLGLELDYSPASGFSAWLQFWFAGSIVGLAVARLLLKWRIVRWQKDGRLTQNVAILSVGDWGDRLAQHLRTGDGRAWRLVGVFRDDSGRGARQPAAVGSYPVLGGAKIWTGLSVGAPSTT
jgi:FlaA1/EpsC-like NDP-sugar epimerase